MRNVNMHGEPIDFFRRYIEVRLDKQKSKGNPMILMGDLNEHWDGAGASYSEKKRNGCPENGGQKNSGMGSEK